MSKIEMYFDSSGDSSDSSLKYLTLSGFVSHESVWRSFELKWYAILDKHNIPSFHMTDACSGRGLFQDWEKEKIKNLFIDLLNVIGEYRQDEFECYSSIISLKDYRKAKENIAKLRSPESICTNECAGYIPFPNGCTGIKLFFDQNEKFMHKINRNWERKKKQKKGWPSQIESIKAVDSSLPGIQAADIFAWLARNKYEKPNGEIEHFFDASYIIAGHFCEYYDYEKIILKYPKG